MRFIAFLAATPAAALGLDTTRVIDLTHAMKIGGGSAGPLRAVALRS